MLGQAVTLNASVPILGILRPHVNKPRLDGWRMSDHEEEGKVTPTEAILVRLVSQQPTRSVTRHRSPSRVTKSGPGQHSRPGQHNC